MSAARRCAFLTLLADRSLRDRQVQKLWLEALNVWESWRIGLISTRSRNEGTIGTQSELASNCLETCVESLGNVWTIRAGEFGECSEPQRTHAWIQRRALPVRFG